jgi:hypothetical protein
LGKKSGNRVAASEHFRQQIANWGKMLQTPLWPSSPTRQTDIFYFMTINNFLEEYADYTYDNKIS